MRDLAQQDETLRRIAMLTGRALPSEVSKEITDCGMELVPRNENAPQMGGEPTITETDPIVVLFYLLLCDHVQPGVIEQVMLSLEQLNPQADGWELSNQYLDGYGANLAKRLRKLDC